MVEDEFLVEMRGDVFPVEFSVEFGRDGGYGLGFAEDEGEGHFFVALLVALFGEGFGAQDLGGRVGLVPGAEEDVVLLDVLGVGMGGKRGRYLSVESGDVFYFAKFGDLLLDVVC